MMNEKTRQNEKVAERNTPQKVWCVISTDKYYEWGDTFVSIFASREKAVRCMEGEVEEDCETYGEEPRWNDDRTVCEIGDSVAHRLVEKWVIA